MERKRQALIQSLPKRMMRLFIGQNVHEQGDVSATSKLIAKPGMIFSIEPGIYITGDVGVRIEDLVLVTEDGCELLNRLDKTLTIVG